MADNSKITEVKIYTDGACKGNPGPGGWGVILIHEKGNKELYGFVPETTNNRMELIAPIMALMSLKKSCKVIIHSDSAYLINSMTKGWVYQWKKDNWYKGKPKEAVKNAELWQMILTLSELHDISWIKVKGHSTDVLNNRADELANLAVKEGLK